MVQVNSGNVIIDDVWLWRADHSKSGLIKSKANPVKTGLQVNGDDVTGYGVACEHTLEHLLEWNGENGKTYFYQSEFPYDVDQSYGDSKFASYKVNENVSNHEAWGTGVYSYFRDYTVAIDSAIQAPKKVGVKFHNALSVFLNGNGEISHVINEEGSKVNTDSHLSYVCEWGGAAAED
jgi:predicted heme/steroid binding protein